MTSQPDITERQMELFFLYCSPNVFLMTVAWYLLIQKVKVTSPLIFGLLPFFFYLFYIYVAKLNYPIIHFAALGNTL